MKFEDFKHLIQNCKENKMLLFTGSYGLFISKSVTNLCKMGCT
jgi:hypothetical protein